MPQIGDGIIRTVTISAGSQTEFTADSGETWKVTMVYGKYASDGHYANDDLYVAPHTGDETTSDIYDNGTSGPSQALPPIGTVPGDSTPALQPILIDDSNGMYLANNGGDSMVVTINAIRVS